MCVCVCPRGVLELTPLRARVAVYCNTREKLRAVTDVCKVGCVKCMKCVKTCPAKAVSLQDNRIVIDQLVCLSYGEECNEACVASCARKIFRYTRPKMQIESSTMEDTINPSMLKQESSAAMDASRA